MTFWITIDKLVNQLFNAETIKLALDYNSETPLIFTQLYFWIFFAIVLSIYSFIYKKNKLRNAFLFLVSIFFYYKTSGFFFSILLFSTFSDYLIGFAIEKGNTITKKKCWLGLSIFINLFVLFYFKYAYFFADSFNQLIGAEWHPINHFAEISNQLFGSSFRVDQILLPVGISFFTFQTMSYSIDIYRKEIKPVRSIIDFGFYVSFFPQLVAGPIVRAAKFIPQLYEPYSLTKKQFGIALFWIMNGLLKKVILADYIALNLVDRVFENPEMYTGVENLMALYGYSLQVYADFSGYTDIAIGIAMLLGFSLPKNFDSPYKAESCGNFWKRWHISLSSWLKDYLYIPMGGNRGGSIFTFVSLAFVALFLFFISGSFYVLIYFLLGLFIALIIGLIFPKIKGWYITNINIMITMLLGGLWHGASWNFVIWGAYHGILLSLSRSTLPVRDRVYEALHVPRFIVAPIRMLITFHLVCLGWIFFRAATLSDSVQIITGIPDLFAGTPYLDPSIFAHGAVGISILLFAQVIQERFGPIRDLLNAGPPVLRWAVLYLLIFLIITLGVDGGSQFIYFQF